MKIDISLRESIFQKDYVCKYITEKNNGGLNIIFNIGAKLGG
ncbi:hypothetical protein [Peribacillus muralis]|nr:hypothetical protein [Peribacillus muralis]